MRRHSAGQSLWRHRSVVQIEQGTLAHFVADAFGAHESVCEVGLARGSAAGLGAADEHGLEGSGGRAVAQYP